MKQKSIIVVFLALALVSCRHPNEVELKNDLELETVVDVNSTLERASVDSTAMLPRDQDTYAGQILLSSVTTKSFRGVERTAISRVVFERRDSVIVDPDNIRRGFASLRFPLVQLDGTPMAERTRFVKNMRAGFEYVRDVSASYSAKRRYTWQLRLPLNLETFEASIESPDDMEVLSPVGGTVLSRNEDVELKWNGRGSVYLILSILKSTDPTKPLIKPIFSGVINKENGKAKLSKKILKALPAADAYVFTFVRLNREEKTIGRFEGRVLVQASSIHNSVVVLR